MEAKTTITNYKREGHPQGQNLKQKNQKTKSVETMKKLKSPHLYMEEKKMNNNEESTN